MEAELDEELRAHLEHQVGKHIRAGLSPEEAERRARFDFGDLEQVKDACRSSWGVQVVDALASEVRFGLRQVRHNLVLSTLSALVLALGIAANTMMFNGLSTVVQRLSPHPATVPRVLAAQNFVPKPMKRIEAGPRRIARKVSSLKRDRHSASHRGPERRSAGLAPSASENVSVVTAGFVSASGAGPISAATWTARYVVESRNGFVLISETRSGFRPAAGEVALEMTIHSRNVFYSVGEVQTDNPEDPQKHGWKPLILYTQSAISNPTQGGALAVMKQSGQYTSVSECLSNL